MTDTTTTSFEAEMAKRFDAGAATAASAARAALIWKNYSELRKVDPGATRERTRHTLAALNGEMRQLIKAEKPVPAPKKARKTRGAPATTDPDGIGPDTPLRLKIAASIAYPDGSIGESGLRREIARGNLECERVAGKQYVTLAGIERMRAKCRVDQKDPASTSANAPAAMTSTSFSTEKTRSALAAAQAIAEGLKRPSKLISPESTSPIGRTVIPLR